MNTSEHAGRALALLDELGGAESTQISDEALRAELAPLTALPAMGFHCSRCQQRIAWWALHSRLALIVFAERRALTKTRRAGVSDLDQSRENPGLEAWIDQASRPGGRIKITEFSDPASSQNNASGYPLRTTFSCRCGAEFVTRNTTRLRGFLIAGSTGSTRILL